MIKAKRTIIDALAHAEKIKNSAMQLSMEATSGSIETTVANMATLCYDLILLAGEVLRLQVENKQLESELPALWSSTRSSRGG